MDRIRALEVFCAVAETNSFAGAARVLSISPPSVTRIINELEAYLGTPLLLRTTRTVSLTEVGNAYFSDAKRILSDVKAADDAARGSFSKPSGTLRITASVLFGQYYVAPVIEEYLDLYPEVSVEAVFVDRVTSLIDEGFDIAVRIGPLPDSGLRAIRVGAVRAVICGSPEYFDSRGQPQNPRDLAQHNTIGYSGVNSFSKWEFDGGITIQIKPRLTYNTVASCIASAEDGWGLARALSYQVGPALGEGRLQTTLEEFTRSEWPINLVHPHGSIQSAKVRNFLDLAKQRLGNDVFLN